MIYKSDIIIYKNDLWISQDYLLNAKCVDRSYLRVAKHRANNNGKSWKHDVVMNKCYFKYSNLPRLIKNKLPDHGQLSSFAIQFHDDIFNLIFKATNSSFKLFLKFMSEQEARSAAIVYEASIYVKNNNISLYKSDFFMKLTNELKLQDFKYLPFTWRNLRNKIKAYTEGSQITDVVYAKNKNNNNRSKFADNDLLQSWLLDLSESGKNYSTATIFRKINLICEQHNINSPSQRWVSDWFNKPETQFLINQRYGSGSRFNYRYRVYTPTKSALYAGDCWEIDGTRVNIIDHKVTTIKDGKRKTTNEFLYIVAVRDVMSGHVLGWEYCYNESSDVIINAIAMAVRNTNYLPYELRYDKFPGHTSQEWQWLENKLCKQGVIMTQTAKAEGKAHIERWWGTLQNVFMVESELYYGEGIRSTRRYAHHSKEYIQDIRSWAHKQGFDFNKAVRESDKVLNAYSNTPVSTYSKKFSKITQSPRELHSKCTHPNSIDIDITLFCYLFGLRKDLSIRNYMIQTQIDGAVYYYSIDKVDLIERFTGIKIVCCFDYENLDKVHLFDNDSYLGTFKRITLAQQYGPNKDLRSVGKLKSVGEKMKVAKNKKLAKAASLLNNETCDEISVMLTGKAKKHIYERAETEILQNEWGEELEEISLNIRDHY